MPEIKPLSPEIKKRVLQMQQNELTEYHIYTKVAGFVKNPENKATLLKIATTRSGRLLLKKRCSPYNGRSGGILFCR